MPIRPPPMTCHCAACGWSKTVAPRSDALSLGDFFTICPACGHAPLAMKPANVARAALGAWADALKRLWR